MYRKKKNKALWVQHGIISILAAFSGYLFAAGMHPGADVLMWMEYEQEIVNGMPESFFARNYFNQYTIPVIAAFEAAYILYALIYYMENRDLMPGRTYGSAQWADPADINARIMDKCKDSKGKNRPDSCFYYVDEAGGYHDGRYHKWKNLFKRLTGRRKGED